MKILVFDTETTGLPKKRSSSFLNPLDWPHIVQLSYILYDTDKHNILEIYDNIIKLEKNIVIPSFVTNIHKITKEISNELGKNIKEVLTKFKNICYEADLLVGHNINFDKNMILVESMRNNIKPCFVRNKKIYCTMNNSKNICKINNTHNNSFKPPKLIELYKFYFKDDSEPDSLHNSMTDVFITLRCFGMLYSNLDYNKECLNLNFINILCSLN